jgi:hypothetical protein
MASISAGRKPAKPSLGEFRAETTGATCTIEEYHSGPLRAAGVSLTTPDLNKNNLQA